MRDYIKHKPWTWGNQLQSDPKEQQCLHRECPECHGTGRKKNGLMCVHHLSCPCPSCTPFY